MKKSWFSAARMIGTFALLRAAAAHGGVRNDKRFSVDDDAGTHG
ncbi:hypothetical protein [Burkholderia alba]|nr:hypothetical protein [Burkholderia alba]